MPKLSVIAFLFIAPSCAAKGVIDGKKAAQLVNSVFSQENTTKLNELEKPRLNSADEAAFMKMYHGKDVEETDEAAVAAEKYSEVPFDAIVELLKVPEQTAEPEQPKKATKQAAAASHLGPKHQKGNLRHAESEKKPPTHPASSATPKTFIDLGSGIGRVVLFACALGSFESCEGVELSESRYNMSVDALAKFKHLSPAASKKVTFVHGNLLDDDAYFKKDVMLLDNSFLSDGVQERVVRKFDRVSRRGSIMLLTQKLNQLSPRVATYDRVVVQGKDGQRQHFFKYVRT